MISSHAHVGAFAPSKRACGARVAVCSSRPVRIAAATASGASCTRALVVASRQHSQARISVQTASGNGASAGNGADAVYDTVVVGAGISGLVTAQALATKHADSVHNFLVTEARERVGGNITSMSGDGYIWEEGPNSFQPNDAMLMAAVSLRGRIDWQGT